MVVFAAGTRTEGVRVQTLDLFRGEHASFVPLVQHRAPPRQETDSTATEQEGNHG
jgi:hypothetical protein